MTEQNLLTRTATLLILTIAMLITSCEDGNNNPVDPAPTARIIGTVVTIPGSAPVSGAQVYTEPASETVLTASDGTFEIKGVANGSYIVKARHVLMGEGSATVSVASGQTGRADIVIGRHDNGGDDSTGNDDSTGGPGDPNPMPGLIAHFPLDGNAIDMSNHMPTGRINGAVPTMNRRNEQGKAMRFDGVNDFIEVPAANHPRIQEFPLTWSVWVRHDGTPRNEWPVAKYLHPNGDGLGFCYESGKWVNFYSSNFFDNWCRYDGSLPADGRWHHVAFTVDASGMKTYVDGIEKGSIDWRGRPVAPTSDTPLRFGIIPSVHPTMPPDPWRGDVDDFMVFDRVLTPMEIQQLARR